jgi:hypothetical protein
VVRQVSAHFGAQSQGAAIRGGGHSGRPLVSTAVLERAWSRTSHRREVRLSVVGWT